MLAAVVPAVVRRNGNDGSDAENFNEDGSCMHAVKESPRQVSGQRDKPFVGILVRTPQRGGHTEQFKGLCV